MEGVAANDTSQQNGKVDASIYRRYQSTRDHIYNVTDTYVGSDEKIPRKERVLNLNTLLFEGIKIELPEAIERVFVEISSNSGDNVARSIRRGIDPGIVDIKMNRTTISVRNGGIPIPIEIHPTEKIWVPQLIFGVLHSSSNYDKNRVRTECGRNGYGAKLTNIFSKKFMVIVGDPNNKLKYTQIWGNNMKHISEPLIDKNYTGKAFVEIVYELDFERFGYKEYPDEAFSLFARHAADMSFTGKVPVSFNGVKLNVQDTKKYVSLYLGSEAMKKSITYYKWAPGVKTKNVKGVLKAVNKGVVPVIEMCAVDTPYNAINVSFVNGMWTKNGGVHADAAFKALSSGVLKIFNKNRKGKAKKGPRLTSTDVKRHISIFISCWLGDPKFDGQTKTALRSPTPKITLTEDLIMPVTKWELFDRLYAELEAKQFKASSKTDGKKRKFLVDPKGEDANDAGTAKSANCTLYVTEGKSAMGFAAKMLSLYKNGRDFIGLLPLKGKPLNVMNSDPTQYNENAEIRELKKMLGLREKVDYLIDDNYKTLRYGHLMILADADTDGKHILGLVLNFFHCRFPSLLARGYVKYLRTKILDVRKGKQVIKFYNTHDYEEWQKRTPNWKTWEHSYFKGLGTSEDEDIKDEFKSPKVVQCFYDDIAPKTMELAFHKKFSDERKDWIKNWIPDFGVETMEIQPISAFINHEFIQFSISDISRSIPRFMDGLKRVQRKIIWGSMKKWGEKACSPKAAKVKVGNLASYVSEKTEYHHGPKSLCDAIVNMVHDFAGSNNLPYFEANGQFGTRNMLGKDASEPRYTRTRPQWWWNCVFKKEDMPLLKLVIDEGKECEPVTFLPIIPLHIINGTNGIGTGHSTFIPNHDPMDICMWLKAKINGYKLPTVLPWYRGFRGTIKLKPRKKRKPKNTSDSPVPDSSENNSSENNSTNNSSENIDMDDPDEVGDESDDPILRDDVNFMDPDTKYTMVTTGLFTTTGNKRKKVTVTELPIGRSMHDYNLWLTKQRENKNITGFSNYSKHDIPKFEITGMKNPSVRKLKLSRSFGMSNMVLLDVNDRPIKYNNTLEILESFYALRLPYYTKRKEFILGSMQRNINLLNDKIRFIISVIHGFNLVKTYPNITVKDVNANKGILIMGLKRVDIVAQMELFNFDPKLLKSVTLNQCTEEKVNELRSKLEKELKEKEQIESISPEKMWENDIDGFIGAYIKRYGQVKAKKNVDNLIKE